MSSLLTSGDLISVCRRLLVIAYEDIGLANPPACSRAANAVWTAQQIGLPEARIPLANAVIELALSPKSNSAMMAVDHAQQDVLHRSGKIPTSLKDAHFKGAEKLGHGTYYQYPHDYPNDWVAQQYLPDSLKENQYFSPKGNSKFEELLKKQYETLWHMQHESNKNH